MSLLGYDENGALTRIAALMRSISGNNEQFLQIAGYDSADDMMKMKTVATKFREGFPGAAVDTAKWDVTNSGMTATVSGGNLTIATGTTINASYTLLSKQTFRLPVRAQFGFSMSQRIVNQDVLLELVSVNAITGLPDGLNAASWRLNGATATQGIYEVQGQGQTALASSAVTIPTTASTSILEFEPSDDETWFFARGADTTAGRSGAWVRNTQTPDPNALYKLRIRVVNGAVAPASTTNVVIGFVACTDYAELTAEITGGRGQNIAAMALPVIMTGGNLTGGQQVNVVSGQAAHDAVITGTPVRIAGRAVTANYTPVATGDVADLVTTLVGAVVNKPYSIPDAEWTYAGPLAGLTTAADTAVQAAAGAGIRRYLTQLQVQNNSATPTEFQIKDGATVIWRAVLPANMPPTNFGFMNPLRTTANAALNFQAVTAASVVIVNAQGYTAP